MVNYTNGNKTKFNSKWLYIPDYSYRILITGSTSSGKTNALLNLINNQLELIKYIYMQAIHMKKNISS